MKNLVSLATRNDVHMFAANLWRSDAFKNSYRNGGFVWEQVEHFAWLPRMFAKVSNDHLERAHFSTWWNVITIRDDYDNPIIHDLYYLHEMAHAATMPYISDIGREAFAEKMQRNELEASVLSEIQVYFEMPGLREASFDHEIYADRFLDNPMLKALWASNPRVAIETIRAMRRHVMMSKSENLMDDTEIWIRRFAEQNAAFAITWADTYLDVERRMAEFQFNASVDRGKALAIYRDWLLGEAALDAKDNIPFRQEAELFSPFYWANKAKYAEAMKK